jgi:hypothetical protein
VSNSKRKVTIYGAMTATKATLPEKGGFGVFSPGPINQMPTRAGTKAIPV